ncbi:LAMI_0E03444g1_1 [Lachancea mirantina]|uniref:Ubiquitin carboxyl-terminal hydrolase n=1 Tax=Lachancea mirantina TaxID=1230905 RepID=A0A1G4JJN9_9SACH|nr:LAMI_0E03444g1_1 [Lachancea mirantina]
MSFVSSDLRSLILSIFDGLSERFESRALTLIVLVVSSGFLLFKNKRYLTRIMENIGTAGGELTRNFRNNYGGSMFGGWGNQNSKLESEMFRRGGYIGGLVNDGNTCFMNSVLQSLASSEELMKFLDEEIVAATEENHEEQETHVEIPATLDGVKNSCTKKGKCYGKRKKRQARLAEKEAAEQDTEPNVAFSAALKDLLDKLNAEHNRDRPYFKTNKLLKTMSKAPNKNIILGYDQEDAQEFFQTVLSELEKNVKSLYGKDPEHGTDRVSLEDLPADAAIGQSQLGKVETVYIPSDQIDPNFVLKNSNSKDFTPFRLMTPFDGLTAERIGCLQCGENGGIRYSVFSSISLNLPSENIGATLKLSELLKEWVKPEIIEGVECNRCALTAVYEHLRGALADQEKLPNVPEKLLLAVKNRLAELEQILSKPVVDDDDYKKLHTENMIRKCSKSKQILIARPPPLLAIHINRSVFDPRTFMIKKNNSRVAFKSRLNLSPWCCDIDEINLDARLPMSKKDEILQESSEDENVGGDYFAKLHKRFEAEFEDSDDDEDEQYLRRRDRTVKNYDPLAGEVESGSEEEQEVNSPEQRYDALGNSILPAVQQAHGDEEKQVEDVDETEDDQSSEEESQDGPYAPVSTNSASTVPVGPLTYALRSVIVHYGTHNYGHYIAFRRFRGLWWRISDETVYVVNEEELLSTPGVFMLFYEYAYDEETGKLKDDLDWEEGKDTQEDI